MRIKPVIFAILIGASASALAARSLTVEELQKTIGAAHTENRNDDALAQSLADVKLNARLGGATLRQLIAISPGQKTIQALHAIADASALLEPPSNELPNRAAPNAAEQSAIFAQTLHYTVHVLPTLPNFLATRVTEHFVDTMRGLETQESVQRGNLYLIGTHRTPISFRDGRETDDPSLITTSTSADKKGHDKKAKESVAPDPFGGLSSWGEFGPILKVVLGDAIKGKLTWARWEQEDGKPVAAFHFVVDRSISHYGVSYCCEITTEQTASGLSKVKHLVQLRQVGYHGNLEVDPETGAVLRITIEAELRPEDLILQSSMMIEYGPVKIADAVYLCPIHSVSTSLSNEQFESHGEIDSAKRMLLNDVEFTDYHRFGSESSLISEVPASPIQSKQTAASGVPPAANTTIPSPEVSPSREGTDSKSDVVPNATQNSPTPAANTGATVGPNPVDSPVVASRPAGDAVPEIQVLAENTPPSLNGTSDKTAVDKSESEVGAMFTLKSTTRSVEVNLVADDKHGKPILDLKRDEIDLFDNGRKQQLRAFYHVNPTAGESPTDTVAPGGLFSNVAAEGTQIQNSPDLLILLLDESHLAYQDLNRARGEVLRFLNTSHPSSKIALYSLSEHGFRIIEDVTGDHALVAKKLAAWTPEASAVSQAIALDQRNRQQFDTVHSAQDLNNVNGNNTDIPDTVQTADPNLRQMGDDPLKYALAGLTALARHFASVQEHKTVAWISGDSALADWQDKAVGVDRGSKQLEGALLHTQEALNEAHMVLYVVDASAIEGGAIDASLANRNIEVNPVSQGGASQSRDLTAGRTAAQMQQDLHGIQSPIRQLAEATGGRAINKSGDLKASLDVIDRNSSSYYELGFDPDTSADDKFHSLSIKIPTRKDVVLRYRTGYLYNVESANMRQRLQDAVWSPQDATGIGLTAETGAVSNTSSGMATVKLRIRFPGLTLEQKGSRWTDQLYVFVAERDDATQQARSSNEMIRLSLNQATFDSGMPSGIPYQHEVEVKSKFSSVRVIVLDGNSGKMGSVTVPASALRP
jgi:VWFA-related protein